MEAKQVFQKLAPHFNKHLDPKVRQNGTNVTTFQVPMIRRNLEQFPLTDAEQRWAEKLSIIDPVNVKLNHSVNLVVVLNNKWEEPRIILHQSDLLLFGGRRHLTFGTFGFLHHKPR